MRYTLTLLAFLFIQFAVKAQAPIATDRPDQTESPFLTPAGYIQTEIGIAREKIANQVFNTQLPTILWKYGINKNVELRLITEANQAKIGSNKSFGIVPTTIGIKAKLNEENGIWPEAAFIGHLEMPTAASKDFKATYYAPSFRFNFQHSLSSKTAFSYNLGAQWDGETPDPQFLYTGSLATSLTSKFGGFIELYGFAPQNSKADHRFDAGLTYLVNNNAQIDVSAGFGITENAPKHFISCGYSFRFNAKK
jgi:Putative MetA-pathway of phenol degradation